jgi:hypothetical protein
MKSFLLIFVVLTTMLIPVAAQRIETQASDRTRVVHLKTALSHLTIIEVAEPVVQVAAGSPSFKVEWRENKVFVQPTEADAATNLFIWTASQRLNYELEPAGAVAEMDFAIDQMPVRPEAVKPTSPIAPTPASPSITELLLTGEPVWILPSKQRAAKPVEVWISDLYEMDGRLLIRYAVRNHSSELYSIETPVVYRLDGVGSPQSLHGLANSQLGDEQAAKLKVKQQTPVKVLAGQIRPARIAPGEDAVGVVALQLASSTHPTILRLEFRNLMPSENESSDGQQPQIAVYLVR